MKDPYSYPRLRGVQFRTDEVARGESRIYAAEYRMRQARSSLFIVEQALRERRRRMYEECST